MGRDKAMLELGGKTLLARAVETLRSVKGLQSPDGRVEVTLCGERDALEGADRAIVDRYPACGPLGGIEAALHDLASHKEADWAFFIPVDMPLLSNTLIELLLSVWTTESQKSERVRTCLVEVEGRPQPLVSLVHRSVLAPVRDALESGSYKVVPVLQSAGACCASFDQEPLSQNELKMLEIQGASVDRLLLQAESGQASQSECPFIEYRDQFINVNTEADLIEAATLLSHRGWNKQPGTPAR